MGRNCNKGWVRLKMICNEGTLDFSVTPFRDAPRAGDFALYMEAGSVWLRGDGGLPTFAQAGVEAEKAMPLLTTRDGRLYLLCEKPRSLAPRPIGVFRTMEPRQHGFYLITAYHLHEWLQSTRFCSRCGGRMSPSETERAMRCESCGRTVYPVISPAVAVAITDGDRILLAQNLRAAFKHYTLVAGYVEAGETLEETVHREVMEEVGLRVKNLRYVGSQPWGLSQSEMVGFAAELDGSDRMTIQQTELTDARWFTRSELEGDGNPASLTFTMIERFRKGEL